MFLLGPMAGLSGGDIHALRLVDHLSMQGSDVSVLAPEGLRAHLPPRSRAALVGVRGPLDDVPLPMPLYVLNVSLRMLLALARAPRAGVVVAASHFFQDVIPCVVQARRHGARPVAYVYHLVAEEREPADLRSRVSIALERLSVGLLRRAGALVFVDNPATKAALEARGFPPRDLLPTGNAYDSWEELPRRTVPEHPTLVTVGRLTEEKGIWDALEVVRRLPGVRLVVVGDGPLREPLRARVAAEGLEHVELLGFVDEAEKWRALRSASAYLAPSREEGWGIAVGEAITAGLPVAAYDLPAYAHFGDRLLRVPTGDTEALADAATQLLARAGSEGPNGSGLPLWGDVLAAERAAIERLHVESEPVDEAGELRIEPRRRQRIAAAIRRDGVLPVAESLARWVGGYAASFVKEPAGSFAYRGRTYPYHVSRNGRTWMTERGVELPIFAELVRGAEGRRVLEVGRTLNGYFDGLSHTVVDKYDEHAEVARVDALDYRPAEPFDLIVAVSTVEHIGWDELPRDRDKALRAVEHLRSLLAPGGELVFDWPLGAHPGLDEAADSGVLPVEGCLRRVGRTNRWVEASWAEVRGTPYDDMIWRGNAIAFCRLGPV